jgi:hypothetical protein
MTTWTAAWFVSQGFVVWHVPGMSRAWRREMPDGSYLLVTDLSGFDLPAAGETCIACHFTALDEILRHSTDLNDEDSLSAWIQAC